MSINILICKISKKYYIEIYNKSKQNYSFNWEGENLLDAYNLIYSEILKLNVLNDKIIFFYKIEQSGFIRYQNNKKSQVNHYLGYCYPESLNNITYTSITIKDIKKDYHHLIFLSNKNEIDKIKLFIDSFGLKKKKEYLFDLYNYQNIKYGRDEVHCYVCNNLLTCMYFDQVGLRINIFYQLFKSNSNINEYLNEITYNINTFIRTLYGYKIDRIIVHSYINSHNIELTKFMNEIDHYNLEILNEK